MVTIERRWPDPEVAKDLAELRRQAPLTHCITNRVADNFTANVLLAVGASPAMIVTAEEARGFATLARALLVNVGTITPPDAQAMEVAAAAAKAAGRPWVLDPVGAGALPYRTGIVKELLRHRPTIIRGNASEILAVAGAAEGGGKGVESTAGSGEALPRAKELAAQLGAVLAVSGAVDYLTDGTEVVAVPGGHPSATRVTATGCALGALMAALAGAGRSPLSAAVSASVVFKVAAERAARGAAGLGSFAVAFLDELSRLGVDEG
ncbi:MAG TPA: hydroxyethylthiazole kinase [Anaeromyxobacter sp.]|nr:hydroxyethylthiazole kinase [Anaeromyxobacter sp.]